MKKIFIAGSINTDLVITTPYMPKAGETLTGSGFMTAHGGKGANQAVAAARLGGNVVMRGCVGNDDFGNAAINALKKDGVDISNVRKVDGVSTGTAVIIIENSDNRIILDKGANACLSKEDIDKVLASANKGDIYLTQLENPIDVIGYGMKAAKEKGLFVVLNPAPANVDVNPYIKYCDLITPNETEAELFGGENEILKNADKLIVTLGAKGFKFVSKDGEKYYSCLKVKAIDTTAAGDTLCGGLVAKLACGETIEQAALFGSKAASIACTRKGVRNRLSRLPMSLTKYSGCQTT